MLKFVLFLIFSKFIPIKKNTVFFDSFHGQYNDNPKFISEKLHELYSNAKIVWCISDKGKDLPPKYATCIKYGTSKYYYYALNSSVVVDNNVGIRTLGFKKHKCFFLDWIIRKRHQLCVSTWHGTPIKFVGKDQIKRKSSVYYTATDCLISGSDYHSKHFGAAFYIPKKDIKMYGMPRTDILFGQSDKNQLKNNLGIPVDKKIVLFAPTFRDDINNSGINQLKEINCRELLNRLNSKFGGEFVFIYRVHHTVAAAINTSELLINGVQVIDGNEHDDMAEYLSVTDVLITDYSGSLFDFAVTYKPCFLFAHDLNEYAKNRGLYIDFESLPFPKAYTAESLYMEIDNFEYERYEKKVRHFNKRIGNCEDGNASYRVVNDIITHLKKNI